MRLLSSLLFQGTSSAEQVSEVIAGAEHLVQARHRAYTGRDLPFSQFADKKQKSFGLRLYRKEVNRCIREDAAM
jgi:hypothetical protein